MEFKEGRYIARIWYFEMVQPLGNTMGCLFRDESEPDVWKLQYRIRYYRDNVVHNSKDVKSVYQVTINSDFQDAVSKARKVMEFASTLSGGQPLEEVIIESANLDVIMKRMEEQPWAHSRRLTPEEVAQLNREERAESGLVETST